MLSSKFPILTCKSWNGDWIGRAEHFFFFGVFVNAITTILSATILWFPGKILKSRVHHATLPTIVLTVYLNCPYNQLVAQHPNMGLNHALLIASLPFWWIPPKVYVSWLFRTFWSKSNNCCPVPWHPLGRFSFGIGVLDLVDLHRTAAWRKRV